MTTKNFNLTVDEIVKLHRNAPRSFAAHSDEAIVQFCRLVVETPGMVDVLDIGAGRGIHAKLIAKCGLNVETIDLNCNYNPVHIGDYMAYQFSKQFDGIWCAHTLEHQLNVNLFLKKMHADLKENGILAITVPPYGQKQPTNRIVGGHTTLWNAGLLLYNLILANFDCSTAMVRTYGYNVSVILQKRTIELPTDLSMNKGDIERLAKFFPFEATQGFDGNIEKLNWPELPIALPKI